MVLWHRGRNDLRTHREKGFIQNFKKTPWLYGQELFYWPRKVAAMWYQCVDTVPAGRSFGPCLPSIPQGWHIPSLCNVLACPHQAPFQKRKMHLRGGAIGANNIFTWMIYFWRICQFWEATGVGPRRKESSLLRAWSHYWAIRRLYL